VGFASFFRFAFPGIELTTPAGAHDKALTYELICRRGEIRCSRIHLRGLELQTSLKSLVTTKSQSLAMSSVNVFIDSPSTRDLDVMKATRYLHTILNDVL
jgi:hypothetical protein